MPPWAERQKRKCVKLKEQHTLHEAEGLYDCDTDTGVLGENDEGCMAANDLMTVITHSTSSKSHICNYDFVHKYYKPCIFLIFPSTLRSKDWPHVVTALYYNQKGLPWDPLQ